MELRTQLSEALRGHATVIETSARDEALTAMRAQTLDAAFIELDRTDQNGFNIAARLRRMSSERRMRLIAVTGANSTANIAKFREVGFDLRVAQPIKVDQVLAALHTVKVTSK